MIKKLDLNHLNMNDAYLSALVHYVTLTNQKAASVKFIPEV
ncbi:hypothetical protein [Acholeplasma hippikon]|nr:hypothetical protein [Acholeplasma hippikon]